jgi:ABC-2 type transport system permease protein
MSAAAAYVDAALAVYRRDFLIYVSYRTRLATQVFSVVLNVALFYYVSRLVNVDRFDSPDEYFAYVVVGILTLRGLATSFNAVVTTVRQELVAGTFERMVASPFGALPGVVSLVAFPMTLAFALSIVTLVVAALVFGVELEWSTLPLALPVALLAALAFAPFSLLLGAAAILFKQAGSGAGFVLAAIAFSAGVFFPPELLPSWISWVAEVQPFTPTLDLVRHLVVGLPLEDSAWALVGEIAAFAAVLLPVSYLALRGAINVGQRRGTITEY